MLKKFYNKGLIKINKNGFKQFFNVVTHYYTATTIYCAEYSTSTCHNKFICILIIPYTSIFI